MFGPLEQVLEANLQAEERSAAALGQENSKLQEQLRVFKLKSSKAMAEIDEEEGQAAWFKAQVLERQQGQQQISQEMRHWYESEEYQLEMIQGQLDFDEKNMSRQLDLLRNEEMSQRQRLHDQEMRDEGQIIKRDL
eukprot:s178_g16.t1